MCRRRADSNRTGGHRDSDDSEPRTGGGKFENGVKNSLNIIRKCNNSPKMLFSRTYQWRNAGLCKILNVFFVLSCIWTVQTNTSQEFSLPYNLQTLENQYGRESWQFKYANLHRSILNGDVPPKYFIWTCGSSGYSMSQ